jgi:hypothetical protein
MRLVSALAVYTYLLRHSLVCALLPHQLAVALNPCQPLSVLEISPVRSRSGRIPASVGHQITLVEVHQKDYDPG